MPNYDKLNLGRTLNDMDGSHYGDDCFNYGSVSGCDEDCPVLLNGGCESWAENTDYMDEDLIKMYQDKEKGK